MNKQASRILTYLHVILFLIGFWSCEAKGEQKEWQDPLGVSADTINIDFSSLRQGQYIIIDNIIDLCGKTLLLPPDMNIRIKGGGFKNGSIHGCNTKLDYRGEVFDKVHISGTWIIPTIRSSMFRDLSYDNALRDVVALSNPKIKNKIIIEDGYYQVTSINSNTPCLQINSNTDFVLNGTIVLTPNNYTHYNIIRTNGDDICLRGKGGIIGDKHSHLGKKGEWGMGIYVSGGQNINIKGLTIKDCWGDCIYITQKTKGITVEKCYLDHGRRQGISIISANNVTVDNCIITNVGGTNPQYAIDIEPNAGDTVKAVTIKNVKVFNCRGGIECYGWAERTLVDDITIKNCLIENSVKTPLAFRQCHSIKIDNNVIRYCKGDESVLFMLVDSVLAYRTRIVKKGNNSELINNEIRIEKEKNKKLNNNKIINI